MIFVWYPKCTTCKKAEKWLKDNNINFDSRDIKTDNPTYEELKAWYEKSGVPLKKLFNTSGLVYKALDLKSKLPTMTEDQQLRLLATDGMLIKRPIISADNCALFGFKEKDWSEKLL